MIRVVLLSSVLLSLLSAFASAQGIVSAEPKAMLEAPHRFWAKSLVFKDVLTEHPSAGRSVKIKGERYFELKTRELERAYATEDSLEELRMLPLNQEYIFSGTVLNKDSVISRIKKGAYVYVIDTVIKQLTDPKNVGDEIVQQIGVHDTLLKHRAQVAMADLLSKAQAGMLSYAKRSGIEFKELFDETSEHSGKTSEIVRGTVNQFDRNSEMKASDVLAQFITIALDRHFGGPAPELFANQAPPVEPTGSEVTGPPGSGMQVVMRSTRPGEQLASITIPHILALPPADSLEAVQTPEPVAPVKPESAPSSPPVAAKDENLHSETLKILESIRGGEGDPTPEPVSPDPLTTEPVPPPVSITPKKPISPATVKAPATDGKDTLLTDLLDNLESKPTKAVETPKPPVPAKAPAPVPAPEPAPEPAALPEEKPSVQDAFAPAKKSAKPTPAKKPAAKKADPAKKAANGDEDEDGLFQRLFGNPVE